MYPYHNRIKQRINAGELTGWHFTNSYPRIGAALVLEFSAHPPVRPIRPHRWQEYIQILLGGEAMAIKHCIAKDFGAVRLYFAGATSCTETWISDINSPSVVWWNSEKDAQKALRGPSSYVVPVVYANKLVEALEACCKALRDAIDIGALSNLMPSLFVDRDVFEAAGILVMREENHENYSIRYGRLHGIELYCSVWGDSK